jgi:HEPN domain-containing protein
MKKITREWVDKAEGDFATAQRELIVQRDPNYDAVCFHSQQCAEKFLKARLQEADIAFRKDSRPHGSSESGVSD